MKRKEMHRGFIDKRLANALKWAAAQEINRNAAYTFPHAPFIRPLYISSTHGRCDRTMRIYDAILTKHAFGRYKNITPGVGVSYN